FGEMKVTCYVFKAKVGDNDVKKTKENIRRFFFKNNMSVMFSINGQAHGHYTTEFITRTLKLNLLKDYLLIHVDCTKMKYEFRKELFMASRDRLRQGDESNELREYLGKYLRKSQLDEINKKRKDSIGLESEDTNELLKSFAKNLPKDSDLFKLLQNTLKLEEKKDKEKRQQPEKKDKPREEKEPFNPKRFPSFFKLYNKSVGDRNIISIPIGGEKTIKFNTDVENDYFDRSEEPGDLKIALLSIKQNQSTGGDLQGDESGVDSVINIIKSSPINGIIKLTLNPTDELKVGDEIQMHAALSAPGEVFEEMILVKIKDKDAPKLEVPKEEESFDNIGLPPLQRVKEKDWPTLEEAGISMNYTTVMAPLGDGNTLEKIYINLDSNVFLNYRSKLKSEDQIVVAEKRFLASVYFHTLFLYMITKKRNYKLTVTKEGNDDDVSIDDYLRDVFDSYYSDFLLNFGMEQLINSLED
ncbi:MAG TPA: hypothetical protein VF455_11540, partial [Chryseobacterium sp.]